jgi:hypothetical protein
MNRLKLHRLHKWIAVSAGVFFTSWLVSGIVLILPGGGAGRRAPRPDYASAVVSPAQAAAAAGVPVADLTLIRVAGRLVYRMETRQGVRMVDAQSGALFAITLETAEQMVRGDYPDLGAVVANERLDRHDWTYRMGPLPVYRLRAGDSGAMYFVYPRDGVVRKVTMSGRVRAVIGSMHTFDIVPGIGGNPRVQKVALAGAASLGLGAVVTGYWIALSRRRKVRAG